MILANGRVYYPHDVPPGANVRPFVSDVVGIRKGMPYRDALGHPQTADFDGVLLVDLGQVICTERVTTILSEFGYKVKRRHA